MKIGIDIRSLQDGDRFRGIGAYIANLLPALAQVGPHHEYTLHSWSDPDPMQLLSLSSPLRVRIIPLGEPSPDRIANRLRNCLVRDIRLRPGDADVYLQPSPLYGLPRGGAPKAAVAYDLIPLIFRDAYRAMPATGRLFGVAPRMIYRHTAERWIYHWSLRQMTSADRIIAISEATRQDVVRFFPLVRDDVVVIPPAVDPRFRPHPPERSVLARYALDRPYLLYVGGVDFRKNVPALVHSHARLRREGYEFELALVGREFEALDSSHPDLVRLRRAITDSPFRNEVKALGFISGDDLAVLYSAAFAFVFPSLYEGFGLPLLEALACGCPVVAYRTSSISEVVGSSAVLLEPSEDIGLGVKQLVSDPGLRVRLITVGPAQAAGFAWDRTAREMLRVLEDLSMSRRHTSRTAPAEPPR